jgi:hypothetical protein
VQRLCGDINGAEAIRAIGWKGLSYDVPIFDCAVCDKRHVLPRIIWSFAAFVNIVHCQNVLFEVLVYIFPLLCAGVAGTCCDG